MRTLTSLLLFAIIAVPSANGLALPLHTDFSIGMSQTEIRSLFGEPVLVTTFHKENESIWGAIETYWGTLPLGSTVAVWSYESKSQMGKGRTELYFLNGSVEVSGIGFSPEGVIYESNGN